MTAASPLAEARAAHALATYAKCSAPIQALVQRLYKVRHDRQTLVAEFTAHAPKDLKLWEGTAVADMVRYLPEGWTP